MRDFLCAIDVFVHALIAVTARQDFFNFFSRNFQLREIRFIKHEDLQLFGNLLFECVSRLQPRNRVGVPRLTARTDR